MQTSLAIALAAAVLSGLGEAECTAGFLDFLGFGKKSTNPPAAGIASVAGLSEQQITDGLKEALNQ
jgi:hypothetical protein